MSPTEQGEDEMNNSRIQFTDTMMDAMMKIGEGNPGAMGAIMDIMEKCEAIDPQSAMGRLSPLLSFDTHGIYGTAVYIIYNDKCGRDARKVLVLLRAVQLGIMPESKLVDMANDQMRSVNLSDEEFDVIDDAVCEQLDGFQKRA